MSDKVVKQPSDVHLIVFACEAGMGSSLMGANQLKKMIKKAKLDIQVIHSPVQQIPEHADIVLVHTGMAKQAKAKIPTAAIVPFQMFFNDPAVKALVGRLQAGESIESAV
ncbi:MAG: PTS lactose transporter subunit IIB [Acidimicrobiia bacterium]|nr:PTS lactose transporter subunit IIB [Acidimicrobiia bacterium]